MLGKGCFEKLLDSFIGWFSDCNGDIGQYGLIQILPYWLENKVMKAKGFTFLTFCTMEIGVTFDLSF